MSSVTACTTRIVTVTLLVSRLQVVGGRSGPACGGWCGSACGELWESPSFAAESLEGCALVRVTDKALLVAQCISPLAKP